jgi:uncharacterized small protein (DUF1192 family)
MHSLLAQHLAAHQYLREELQRKFPDADEDLLHDTVEGLTNLPEILAKILRDHLEDLSLVKALRARIGNMQERATRLDARAERKKALVTEVMERAGIRRLIEPDFSVFLRAGPPTLVVMNDDQIPAEFWQPQPLKLDRRAVLGALKAGRSISGAALGNGSATITVRTR